MTVKDLICLLLEMDDQWLDPRPSSFLVAAQLIRELACHAESSLRRGSGPDIFGEGWEDVNVANDRRIGDREGWNKPTFAIDLTRRIPSGRAQDRNRR